MNFIKILSFLILSVFLFNGVFAVVSYASWENDELQSITIINGNSVNFNADFYAFPIKDSSMSLRVELYNSSDELIYSFLDTALDIKESTAAEYTAQYIVDPSMYGSVGDYKVILNANDGFSSKGWEITLKVVAPGTDVTNPTVTIVSPVNERTYTNMTSFRFIAMDANLDSCEYSLNGGARTSTPCVSGNLTIVPITTVEGANSLVVYATDLAGNEGNAVISFNIDPTATDTTAPVMTITLPEEDEKYTNDRIILRVVTDEDATVTFEMDDGNMRTMTKNGNVFTYAITLSNGDHTVTFYATDLAGNEAEESVDFNVSKKSTSKGGIGGGSSSTLTLTSIGSDTTANEAMGNIPIVLDLTNSSTKKPSVFEVVFTAIANFFKWLFGIKN